MAIALDSNTEFIQTTTNTSCSFSHTCSGSDRFLILSITTYNWTAGAPSGFTIDYNGDSLSEVAKNVQIYGVNNWRHHVYTLVNPDTGTNTVSVTAASGSGRFHIQAGSYTGVDQTSPILTSNTASNPTTGNTMAISLTTAEDAWWFISGGNVDANWTAGANTATARDASGTCGSADSNGIISAQTGNAQLSHSGSRGYGGVALAFKPASAAASFGNPMAFFYQH